MSDIKLDKKQLKSAVTALYLYLEKTQQQETKTLQLLAEDDQLETKTPIEPVFIVVTLSDIPVKSHPNPILLGPLPTPIFKNPRVCMITTDPATETAQLIQDQKIKSISKVIAYSTLKSKFSTHEKRRTLARTFDIFLMDSRLLHRIADLLGKHFFASKKQPIPVKCNTTLKSQVDKILNGTKMFLNTGDCLTIRVGTTLLTKPQLAKNINSCLDHAISNLPKKMRAIRHIYLKSQTSVALPLYRRPVDESS